MAKPLIEIKNIGKCYQLGAKVEGYLSLRDELSKTAKRLFAPRATTASRPDFWALRDVSFSVQQGDTVGIIGRNGAGKSTLLKILSQITPPSEGTITLRGRIASLLEVGTGFHPELTGRENVYLNGAILGMTRSEIKRKFDEIVAFAEVEQFLDTPVKRYSSGMYVRLAFAVAAHLEPEILIVDEVLAVGDSQFQKKCLGKMGEVARGGRTVLFVSHQMAAINNLCERAILLDTGKIVMNDKTDLVLQRYLVTAAGTTGVNLRDRHDRRGTGTVQCTAVRFQDRQGTEVPLWFSGQDVCIEVDFDNPARCQLNNVHFAVRIDDQYDNKLFSINNELTEAFTNIPEDITTVRLAIDHLPIVPGRYSIALYLMANGEIFDWITNAAQIEVEQGDFFGFGRLPNTSSGIFYVPHQMTLVKANTPKPPLVVGVVAE